MAKFSYRFRVAPLQRGQGRRRRRKRLVVLVLFIDDLLDDLQLWRGLASFDRRSIVGASRLEQDLSEWHRGVVVSRVGKAQSGVLAADLLLLEVDKCLEEKKT